MVAKAVNQVLRAAQKCCPSCGLPARPNPSRDAKAFARLFKALGDETRVEIVDLLARAGRALCACEIESGFQLSQPTISHHLKVLRDAGLLRSERRGTWVYYELEADALERLRAFPMRLGE